MDRRKQEASDSREGLLRKSNEDGRSSSIDSDLSLNEFLQSDPLDDASKPAVPAYDESNRLSRLRQAFARRAKTLLITLVVLILIWSVLAGGGFWLYKHSPSDGQSPPWYPSPLGGTLSTWADSYAKASKLVEKMNLIEKVNVTTGTGWSMGLAVGNTGPASNAGFPGLALQDGPLGIRFADNASAFPAGVTVGATWNKELMYARGKAHGLEARLKGINVLLGPCVGPLGRMPAGGRNWEGFGADPYLQGIAAAETVRGIQDTGVMATIKHYIGNEQEHFRQSNEWGLPNAMSSNIGDRTLHELYLWPFADAIRAGVVSVMCSYQMTNNSYTCANSKLLNGVLKDELGFQGFVQSDWLAQRSGVASALAGLDMTMPGDGLFWQDGQSLWGPHLTKSVLNGSLPMSRLNDMVTRVVAAWYQMGQDDESKFDRKGPNFSSWTNDELGYINPGSPDDKDLKVVNKFVDVQGEGPDAHSQIAKQVAAEGSVLVKNDNAILPLSRNGWPAGKENETKYRVGIFGEDAGSGKGPNYCSDRACNFGTLGSGWGSGAVEFPYLITPIEALRNAFDPAKVYVTDFPTNTPPMTKAPEILQDQDVCLVFVNSDGGEGYVSADGIRGDRNHLDIQKGGDLLITQVAEGCGGGKGSTIVVVHAVGPVVVDPWIENPGVGAVILANLPGQESGNAIAEIIFGDVNPSGKLPYTIGKSLNDFGDGGQIMYYPNGVIPQQNFSEGIYIDYRHFDRFEITPRYEFGFGLSYTTFSYHNLVIKTVKEKSRLPAARPAALSPPTYDETVPDPETALFPSGLRKLKKFVYPYIDSVSEIKSGRYPYPIGYDEPNPPSPAGGGEGGNPSLYDVHATVSIDVTNSGKVAGAEVVQLYLSYPDSPSSSSSSELPTPADQGDFHFDTDMTDFPVKVLRGFEKPMLAPGESTTVTFDLTRRDLSFWDVREQNWVMPTEGRFTIRIGASSRDLRAEGQF
ncbi:MAG: hypothetical protein M1818_002185 [Claussenomyces sp. TS43310]|nr:MAG: hypothetical protein M1818_002185 [Claussenomyces sp. TS43310]